MRHISIIILLIVSNLSFAQVAVVIDKLPSNHSNSDSIYLATESNRWNPRHNDFLFTMNSSGKLVLTMQNTPDTTLFRVCRGSWRAVECSATGADVPKHRHIKGKGDTLRLTVEAWRDMLPQQQIAPSATKSVRFVPTQLDMPQLKKKRTIRVYLPPNYFKSKSFPVIYMHDGQNIFDNSTSLTRSEWQVDEILDALHYSHGFGAVVVGIYCDATDRANEFSPWADEAQGIKGDGDKYAKFIVKTLKPFIDSHYRVSTERENTAIVGSGLGGTISLYAAVEYPEVFGHAAVLSPLISSSPKANDYFNKLKCKKEQKFYFATGAMEDEAMTDNVERVINQMTAAGFDTLLIKSNICPYGQNEEWYWGEEFEKAVKFFFNMK